MPYEFILFDLDDTLYSRECGLLREIGHRIQAWVCEHMNLAWEEAFTLRRDYFMRYGTTLNGLIVEHNVDANDYLNFVHDVAVHAYLEPDPALAAMLDALPLRRVIYTNATTEHSRRVLGVLGVPDRFERIISIQDVDLRNKLYPDAYERALALLGAQGAECIMVEDSVRNLCAAKALGMTTVLVREDGATDSTPAFDGSVDYVTGNVLDVERVVQTLLGE